MSERDDYPFDCAGDWVSDLKVMRSGAGYYIGRSYWDTEFGFEGPFSRESGYYANEEDARIDLEMGSFEVRNCQENEWMYKNMEKRDDDSGE